MDKEKQAFEKSSFKRLLDLGNKENQKTLADYYIVSEGRINNFVDCLEKGRAEIAALKAEIERKDEAIVKAKLEIEKQQTWTGHDWEQNYISGAIARKIHRLLEQALHIKEE